MRRLKRMPAHMASDTNSTQRSGTNSGIPTVLSACVGIAGIQKPSMDTKAPTITASEAIKP
jgi:hypothetical protein